MSDEFGKDLMDRSADDGGPADGSRQLKERLDRNESLISKERAFSRQPNEQRPPVAEQDLPPANERFSVMPATGDATHNEQKYRIQSNSRSANTSGNSSSGMPSHSSSTQTTSLKFLGTGQNAKPSPSSEHVTSENYTKIYQKRQRERERLAYEQKSSQAGTQQTTARKQQDEETTLRVRARDLIAQIQWWRSQFGSTDHEPHYISGMISSLEQELHAIDPRYWP